jgi:hypothetical protein
MVNKIFTAISVTIFLLACGLFVYGTLVMLDKIK